MLKQIWVNARELKSATITEKTPGGTLTLSATSYEIPLYLRSERDRDHVVVTFDYLDSERSRPSPRRHGCIVFREGEQSRRIHSISFPAQRLPLDHAAAGDVREQLRRAFRARREDLRKFRVDTANEMNQEIAEELLDEQTLERLTGGDDDEADD